MSLIIIAPDGKLVRQDFFEAPYCSFVHDFLMTRDHVIFPVLPLSGDMNRAKRGGPAYAWDPEKPALLGVVGRREPIDTLKWFRIAPCYVFHTFNAWTDGGVIHCDVVKYSRAPFFPDVEGNPAPASSPGSPIRWSIDLTGGTDDVKETQLSDATGEFPRCDERYAGLQYRHAFFCAPDPKQTGSPVFPSIAHLDLASGRTTSYSVPAGDALSEAVFAPRSAGRRKGTDFCSLYITSPRRIGAIS